MTIWPTKFATGDAEYEGAQSPLPVIWVIGDKGTGKSTFIQTVDPYPPGSEVKTLITDLEGSHAALRLQFACDVLDIRSMLKPEPSNEELFLKWREMVLAIEPGKYTVLGVDPVSDIFMGANQWTRKHPEMFGKTPDSYRGKEGIIFSWGDTALYWKSLCLELSHRFETVVFTSHVKDVFVGGTRSGEKSARGQDLSELATLVLWLAVEKDGSRWALVKKSRLSWINWEGRGKNRRLQILQMLPNRLVPEPGQSYPDLISSYMSKPRKDYGELNEVEKDPSQKTLSEDELAALETEKLQALIERDTAEGRKQLIAALVPTYYADQNAVIEMIRQLDLGAYGVKRHDEFYKALVEAVQNG